MEIVGTIVRIDVNLLWTILSVSGIWLTIGFAFGLDTGRKLDHKALKKNIFGASVHSHRESVG